MFLHGHADWKSRVCWTGRSRCSPSAVTAVREALAVAGIGIDDVATSTCTAASRCRSSTICDGFGLTADDPRGLTLTGGLPYFGGAGNNYSMHGVAETVAECAKRAGLFGLVGANGGMMSKYSVGVYSADSGGVGSRTAARNCRPRSPGAADAGHSKRQRAGHHRDVPPCATTGRRRPGSSSAGWTPTARRFMATHRGRRPDGVDDRRRPVGCPDLVRSFDEATGFARLTRRLAVIAATKPSLSATVTVSAEWSRRPEHAADARLEVDAHAFSRVGAERESVVDH